jgi:hypothetical protein
MRIPLPFVLNFWSHHRYVRHRLLVRSVGDEAGQKRISLFGLRPRQTATLLSILSSLGIMLFTMTVLFRIVSYVIRRDRAL